MPNRTVVGVKIYLEKRKTRQFVGELKFDESHKLFEFTYSERYLHAQNIIPLGPDIPLTKVKHSSKKLFASLQDRLPSRENPAYKEYCEIMGIAESEEDPLILLVTIGRKGPSSFVFEPSYEDTFSFSAIKQYRIELGLTTREFADCFEITQATLVNIENGKIHGKEVIKRLEIYLNYPEVAYNQVQLTGGILHSDKMKVVCDKLKAKIIQSKK